MSILRIRSEAHLSGLKKFIDELPATYVSGLSRVATKGRELLRRDLMSGQKLHLRVTPKDKIGRFTIKGKVAPNFALIFTSYVANLFERGRILRNGKKEPGKYIVTREFKNLLGTRLQGFADQAMAETIDKKAKKV